MKEKGGVSGWLCWNRGGGGAWSRVYGASTS